MAKGNGTIDTDDMERAIGDPSVRRALIEAGDASPSPSVLPRERAQQIVRNISLTTLDQLREARDQIDDLSRAVKAREEAIINILADHAVFAEQAISAKLVMSDALVALRKNFEAGEPPLSLGSTISVERRQ